MTTERSKKRRGGKSGIAAVALAVAASPFIAFQEGVIPYTYADPVWGWSLPTACAGETGPHIVRGQTYTIPQCMAMLDKRLVADWPVIDACIERPIKMNEAVAIADMVHNFGPTKICNSTMIAQLNAGLPSSVWCAQMSRWNKAGSPLKVNRGLTRRRAEGRAICEGKPYP